MLAKLAEPLMSFISTRRRVPSFFVAVHLAGMGHEDDEALVEDGETSQLVQGVGDVGHFRLPRFQMLLQAVHGVDDEDAHPFAAHHLAGFLQDVVDAVAPVVGQDVRHVAVQPAHRLLVDGFRHARSGVKRWPVSFSASLCRW